MYARVTQFRISPEKISEFVAAFQAAVPHARHQKGYRALMALRAGGGSTEDVRVISVWNSLEDLTAGEQNFYLYQALAKCLAFSKGFPLMEGQEVLCGDFPGERSLPADETQF
jgi:heme-degrading monooxygenase HmoA